MPSVHCKRIVSHCSHPRVARLSWNDWNSDHFGNLYRNIQPLSVTMGLVNAWISPRVKLKGVLFSTGCWFHFLIFQLNKNYDIAFNSRQKIEHLKQEKWNASFNRNLNLCVVHSPSFHSPVVKWILVIQPIHFTSVLLSSKTYLMFLAQGQWGVNSKWGKLGTNWNIYGNF